jgi:phenylacetate-CoA ligase
VSSLGGLWTLWRAARRAKREQWYSPNQLRELQISRLQRLGRVAIASPYYKAAFETAGIAPQDLHSLKDLARLPFLEKPTLQQHGEELLTRDPAKAITVATSGSTGQPLRVHRSSSDQAQVSAIWARIFDSYGRGPFDRQVNIGSGRAVAKSGPAAMLRKIGVLRVHQLSSFDPMDKQVELLRRVKPQLLSAYGIGLELVAEAMVQARVTDVRPRIVYTSGTALSARGRALAEEAFGIQPLDVYAANEVGPIAWECPVNRGAMHLNDDTQITEIVDDAGEPVPPGEVGQVVVSQLLCTLQPIIRYRIGDQAQLYPGVCPCGRGTRLMSPVLGRTQHIIRAPDGRTLNTVVVSAILGVMPEVKRYQVQQTGKSDLLILIVPGAGWSTATESVVQLKFRERLGDAFNYHLLAVDDIRLAPGGKFQTILPLGS